MHQYPDQEAAPDLHIKNTEEQEQHELERVLDQGGDIPYFTKHSLQLSASVIETCPWDMETIGVPMDRLYHLGGALQLLSVHCREVLRDRVNLQRLLEV